MTGKELHRLRKARGYTQGALAALLGVSTPTVSRWEAAAQVPPEGLARLSQLTELQQPAPSHAPSAEARREKGPSARIREAPAPRAKAGPLPSSPPPARPEVSPEAPLMAEDWEAAAEMPAPAVHAKARHVPARPEVSAEVVLSAEQAGAVLLEGADLRAYWERVVACRQLLLWRRQMRAGGRRTPWRS